MLASWRVLVRSFANAGPSDLSIRIDLDASVDASVDDDPIKAW